MPNTKPSYLATDGSNRQKVIRDFANEYPMDCRGPAALVELIPRVETFPIFIRNETKLICSAAQAPVEIFGTSNKKHRRKTMQERKKKQ